MEHVDEDGVFHPREVGIHFHCAGYGWINPLRVAQLYEATGVRLEALKKGARRTQIAPYEFDHAGIAHRNAQNTPKVYAGYRYWGTVLRTKIPEACKPEKARWCPHCRHWVPLVEWRVEPEERDTGPPELFLWGSRVVKMEWRAYMLEPELRAQSEANEIGEHYV
jgi:hypothetical protein